MIGSLCTAFVSLNPNFLIHVGHEQADGEICFCNPGPTTRSRTDCFRAGVQGRAVVVSDSAAGARPAIRLGAKEAFNSVRSAVALYLRGVVHPVLGAQLPVTSARPGRAAQRALHWSAPSSAPANPS